MINWNILLFAKKNTDYYRWNIWRKNVKRRKKRIGVGSIVNPVQRNNPLNQVQAEELAELQVQLKQDAIDKSIEEGILVRAENHTEDVLNEKLKDILSEEYKIEIKWQEN